MDNVPACYSVGWGSCLIQWYKVIVTVLLEQENGVCDVWKIIAFIHRSDYNELECGELHTYTNKLISIFQSTQLWWAECLPVWPHSPPWHTAEEETCLRTADVFLQVLCTDQGEGNPGVCVLRELSFHILACDWVWNVIGWKYRFITDLPATSGKLRKEIWNAELVYRVSTELYCLHSLTWCFHIYKCIYTEPCIFHHLSNCPHYPRPPPSMCLYALSYLQRH